MVGPPSLEAFSGRLSGSAPLNLTLKTDNSLNVPRLGARAGVVGAALLLPSQKMGIPVGRASTSVMATTSSSPLPITLGAGQVGGINFQTSLAPPKLCFLLILAAFTWEDIGKFLQLGGVSSRHLMTVSCSAASSIQNLVQVTVAVVPLPI